MLIKVQKCSLPKKAGAFTTHSNHTVFWGNRTLPFSSGPWGDLDHWELFFSCSLMLATTRDETQWGGVSGRPAWAQVGKGHWSLGNMVRHQLGGKGGGLRFPSGSVLSVKVVSGRGLFCAISSSSGAADLGIRMGQSKVQVTFWSPQGFIGHKVYTSK